MKSSFNLYRVFIVASIVSLVIIYTFLWLQTISDKALRSGVDFIAFYAAGRIAETHGLAQVYQPDLQRAVEQAQVGFELESEQILLYNHLPYVVPLTMLAANENYTASFFRWNLLMLATLAAATSLLIAGLPGLQRGQAALAIMGGLLFFPAFYSLLNGQDTALLFIGAALGVWGLLNQQDNLAGLGLSLTTIRPHIALLIIIPFMFKRHKIFWNFVLGASVLALISVILIGAEGTFAFLRILGLSASGEWHGMKEEAMFNLLGILRRGLPMLDAQLARTFAWGFLGAATLYLCFHWYRANALEEKELGLMMILGLFAAPHLHYHDLTLLLVPIFLALRLGLSRNLLTVESAVTIPLALALIFLFANLTPLLKYTVPYVAMFLLACLLWKPDLFIYSRMNWTK